MDDPREDKLRDTIILRMYEGDVAPEYRFENEGTIRWKNP
jgi:hypothetical protein